MKSHARPSYATSICCFSAAVILIATNATLHAEEGTLAQRNACKPDVFRLCQQFIPDHAAITACLQRNTAHLNPDCRAVFEAKPK
ncbi:hypothetical protein [Bradyrhizobium sp. dw_411]|uniref:hypothetical protein n=1 Tax=Bradyrhizobium sp. dw_411 TaxID=2720082 RepID=UPI001BCE4CDA|nr:hypothetical protein [Bradyrhizobium sp. dw_411]